MQPDLLACAGFKTGDGCDQSGTVFSGSYGQLPTCSAPTPHWPSTGKGVIMSYVSCPWLQCPQLVAPSCKHATQLHSHTL